MARRPFTGALAAAAALACAPAALADTATSSNWAGYAIHGQGVSFRSVQGTWTEPTATCTPGMRTYSSYWVGLGGYSESSQALEQIGTEVDCSAAGQVHSTAWYELVPAPSTQLRLTVRPGDVMTGRVSVRGDRVTVSLLDHTRNRGVTKTVTDSQLDLTSAEWIVEAPSACFGANVCQTLPLADFGSATFHAARVRTTTGQSGSISSPRWHITKIKLVPQSRHFVIDAGSGVVGDATPSALTPNGRSFKVAYSQASITVSPAFARRGSTVRAILPEWGGLPGS